MTNSTEKATNTTRRKRQRRPLGSPDLKLQTSQRKGYVRRWVNDAPGRVQNALDGGYEFVKDNTHIGSGTESKDSDLGSNVSQIVGKDESGQPLRSYLMEIKESWYNEDQVEKSKKIDEVDDAIRNGNINGSTGQDGRYIPSTGIKMNTNSTR